MFQFTQNTMWIYASFGMGIILTIAKYAYDLTKIKDYERVTKFFRR